MNSIIVNLFGGPGISKSTTAAGIFSLLKIHSVNCELVSEFAKDLVWEERFKSLKDQVYIFGKQYHRIWRLVDLVDVIITDSPILLPLVYDKNDKNYFQPLVKEMFSSFNNLNFLLIRSKKYDPNGRYQNEEEAKQVDNTVEKVLLENKVDFESITGNYNAINIITERILKLLGKEQEIVFSKK